MVLGFYGMILIELLMTVSNDAFMFHALAL